MERPQIFVDHPIVFALVIIWSFIWKGLALWRAAQNESKPWFIALLVVNTFGILEILYFYVWGKKRSDSREGQTVDQRIFQK